MIGDPVRHSLSPRIHNAAFAALDLDWVYVALPVSPDAGHQAVQAMATLGIEGLSVTMPHKAAVAAAVDRLTPVAQQLGVCNCVFRRDGQLLGHSTDGDGFVQSLAMDHGVSLEARRVAVVGTGGAARSIIEAVGRQDPAEILIVSRTPDRAAGAAHLAPVARPGTIDELASVDVIVNATPIGMTGGPGAECLAVPAEVLVSSQVVVDIVYQPLRTPLLEAADEVGATTINGVGMLVHQAALAFELWTGKTAPLDVMTQAVSEAISL